MVGHKTQNYFRIFFYASLFWVIIGLLHLGSLYWEQLQSGQSNYLSPERWALFISAYFTWSFITTFLYFLIEKNPPSKENFRWLIYLAVTTLVWLLIITLIRQYLASLLWGNSPKAFFIMLNSDPFLYLFNFLKVIMIYGACTGIFYYARMQDAKLALLELQRETAEALDKKSRFQLQALQAQLSPHFLFNSLNSISGMARNQENARIVTTVAHLADLLRYTIEGTHQIEVALEDELNFTRHYIALQTIRFDGCFHYTTDINLSDPYVFCPPFCIQILVENVFAHNELSQNNPVLIQVHIKEENEALVVKVENSLSAPTQNDGAGIALKNLRERLELLYGAKAQLLTRVDQYLFSAIIILPLRYEHD